MSRRKQEIESRRERLIEIKNLKAALEEKGISASIADIGNDLSKYQALANGPIESSPSSSLDSELDVTTLTAQHVDQNTRVEKAADYVDLFTKNNDSVVFDDNVTKVAVVNGKVVTMVLAVVPWQLIKTKTEVIEQNGRNQDSLNEKNLNYILKTLKKGGQQQEAEGYLREDGVIMVIDGSSRRYSCYIAKVPFRIWVDLKGEIKSASALRSLIANHHKSYSSWEKGEIYSAYINERLEESKQGAENKKEIKRKDVIKEICEQDGLTKSRLSVYLGAYHDIPYSLYLCFQSGTSIPRSYIDYLLPKVRQLKSLDQLDELIKSLKPFEDLGFKSDDEVFKYIKSLITSIISQNKPLDVEGTDKFSIKSTFNPEKGSASINIKDADPDAIRKLEQFINELKEQ